MSTLIAPLSRPLFAVLPKPAREEVLPTYRGGSMIQALIRLLEYRHGETAGHLRRLEHLSLCLGEETARSSIYSAQVDDVYLDLLAAAAPLHDIGKLAIPDRILQKPGPLTAEERQTMQTHTLIGSEFLHTAAHKQQLPGDFWDMARDIARYHHERFDGQGYPHGLKGQDIPLSARLVAIADVYDALRSPRVYKPALRHDEAVRILTQSSPGQFDPELLIIFHRCAGRFSQIYKKWSD